MRMKIEIGLHCSFISYAYHMQERRSKTAFRLGMTLAAPCPPKLWWSRVWIYQEGLRHQKSGFKLLVWVEGPNLHVT